MSTTVGEKIKQLRKAQKMTQKELAEKMGLSKSTIAMYEIGKNYPNLNIIKQLCRILNTSGDYLIGLSETFEQADTKPCYRNNEGHMLYDKLDTEDKAEIRGEMKHMLKADKYSAELEAKE